MSFVGGSILTPEQNGHHMPIDLGGLIVESLFAGLASAARAVWGMALDNPWLFMVLAAAAATGVLESRVRRRRRS